MAALILRVRGIIMLVVSNYLLIPEVSRDACVMNDLLLAEDYEVFKSDSIFCNAFSILSLRFEASSTA